MKKYLISILILWGGIVISPDQALGQDHAAVYAQHIAPDANLRSGKSYEHFYLSTDGNQYLTDALPRKGNVLYDGVLYRDILINYDIHNHLVYTNFTVNGFGKNIILNEKRIRFFEVEGMRFVYISENQYPSLLPGIYQEVFHGETYSFWIKKHKKLNNQTVSTPGANRFRFAEADQYFIRSGNITRQISSKKELLKALGRSGNTSEIIRQNRLRLNPARPEFAASVKTLLKILDSNQ
ncbi:MAG: hypothetical protein R3C61_18435 [Bacteroidia bacterium]